MYLEENLEDIAKLHIENPYPVFRVSSEGILLYSNEAGKCMLTKWDCVIGQIINPDLAVSVAEAYRENLIKKDVEIQCLEKAFSFTLVPVRDGDYVNIYGVDVTERRKAEKELEKIQKQVIQQERLKAIGQMSSGIIHDINNALVPILGYSEILIITPAFLADKEKTLNYLTKINSAAKHAASVLKRLKDFYRAAPSNILMNPVDLNILIKDIVGLTRPRWKNEMEAKGILIKVETDLKGSLLAVGEASEFREFIVNLIFNAVDALPAGGKIILSTRSEEEKAVFEISDTGEGMPEHVKLRCFEPFFSTKGEKGTGLGLAMVYATVKRYNGTIQIESEEGKGTKFTIKFPSWQEKKSEQILIKECAPENSARILVVDDNPLVREVLKEYLSFDKHLVETAESGFEAMEKLGKIPFDVVITDMVMPRMSGTELAVLVRKNKKDVPVILLTGFGELVMINGVKPAGVDIILEKPVSADKLRNAISGVFKKK